MTDVVEFFNGTLVEKTCPTCGYISSHWEMSQETIDKAIKICDELNNKK
jgi:hypothetical protein